MTRQREPATEAGRRLLREVFTDTGIFNGEDMEKAILAIEREAAAAARRETRDLLDWPWLANAIRAADGNHDLGAGELAQRLADAIAARLAAARPVAGEDGK